MYAMALLIVAGFVGAEPFNGPLADIDAVRSNDVDSPQITSDADQIQKPSVRERLANRDSLSEKPETLYGILGDIERAFGEKFSVEPLPEHCLGATTSAVRPDSFSIAKGETFDEVIARFEEVTHYRWAFTEIRGIPVILPKTSVEPQGTLLNTAVSVQIQASSMWEAFCQLAYAVNKQNRVDLQAGHPLLIKFIEPSILQTPAPIFLKKRNISLSFEDTMAREALCAIFEAVGGTFRYHYNCIHAQRSPLYDYVSVSNYDAEGKVIVGGRIRRDEYKDLREREDWMSDEKILALQVPAP